MLCSLVTVVRTENTMTSGLVPRSDDTANPHFRICQTSPKRLSFHSYGFATDEPEMSCQFLCPVKF